MHAQEVSVNKVSTNSVKASQDQIAELQRLIGLQTGQGTTINFLWVNLGGGAATTVVGSASTVTVTQTVVGGEATAPPAVTTGEAATTTVAAPATGTTVVAGGATHSVTVGGPQGLAFDPPQLSANPGDTVIFTFLSQNHTATQSAFDKPCEPLAGGMDSGFQANPNNTINPPPQVAMQVMVSTPLCKLSAPSPFPFPTFGPFLTAAFSH
jgi:plastocyanin